MLISRQNDTSAQVAMLREAAHRQAENERLLRNDTGRGVNLSLHANFGAIDGIRIVLVTQLKYMTAQQFTEAVDTMAQELLQIEEELQ